MASKRRFLDVWIIESNTVYREVPFTSVIDWVQQGRLLGDDMLRWSGQAEWFRLGSVPAFAAYLPKRDPLAVGDEAEALEPVEVGFRWKRGPQEEDDDVDMIPLIDVSLVLLIFFLMVLGVGTAASMLRLPFSSHAYSQKDTRVLWIDVRRDPADPVSGVPVYSFGLGPQTVARNLPAQEGEIGLLSELARFLGTPPPNGPTGILDVDIRAEDNVPAGTVRRLLIALETDPRFKARIGKTYYGVQ